MNRMNTQTNSLSELQLQDSIVASNVGDESAFDLESMLCDPAFQQIIIRTHRDGVDHLIAYFRCEFAADEKRHVLHVPVQPPMAVQPNVQAIGVDEDIRSRITDCQKFGVRVEVLLDRVAAESKSVVVEIVINSPLKTEK